MITAFCHSDLKSKCTGRAQDFENFNFFKMFQPRLQVKIFFFFSEFKKQNSVWVLEAAFTDNEVLRMQDTEVMHPRCNQLTACQCYHTISQESQLTHTLPSFWFNPV